jgi:hypothetical protein
MLNRNRGFAVIAIATLALGIGANTAIFSVVKAVLLQPLAYPEADRLVVVWERNTAVGKQRDPVAPLNFEDWKSETSIFEDLAAYRYLGFTLSGVDDPDRDDCGICQPLQDAESGRHARPHLLG